MEPSLDWAIKTWNCRIPRTRNCPDCRTAEDLQGSPAPFPSVGTTVNLASVLLHELGHCAVGLGHPNHQEFITDIASQPWRTGTCDSDSNGSCGDQNSFTDVGMATEILAGADGIRGTRDDTPLNQCGFIAPPMAPWMAPEIGDPDQAAPTCQSNDIAVKAACTGHVQCCPPCPGSACPTAPMVMQDLAWYRQVDNNPFVVDGVIIDRNTFTRNKNLLPAGSTYAANANRRVGVALGYPESQAVMYSTLTTGQGWNGLGADDVNMLRMAMTGVDRFANSPAPPDDYTLVLERVSDCAQADIEVFDAPLAPTSLGACVADTAASPTVPPVFGLVLHYSVTPEAPLTKPMVGINLNFMGPMGGTMDLLLPLIVSGFEPGDLREWNGCP